MPLDPSLDPIFDAAGQLYNVDPMHLKGIALTESAGNPEARSLKGALGLMQLMPDTAKGLGVNNPLDPVESILGGAKYYAEGLDKHGDPTKALMYYNAGPNEARWGNSETQAYPAAVAKAIGVLSAPPTGAPGRVQVAANAVAPLTGTDALAAVGGRPSAPQQVAQAGGMSDDDLLNGFMSGTLPFMQQPKAPVAQGGGLTPQQAQALSLGLSLYGEKVPGYVEDTSRMGAGGALSPDYLRDKAAAEKTGTALMQPGPRGLQNIPGSVPSQANTAGAIAGAEAAAKAPYTVTEARPGNITTTVKAVSDAAAAQSANQNGGVPGIRNDTGIAEGGKLAAETFSEHRKSFIANQSSIQNLQNYLDAAGKVGTGRGVTFSANTAAWLKSVGVDPEKIAMADPAQVQIMQKAAGQMVQSTIHGLTPRPAFQEFALVGQSLPDPEKQPEANKQIASALLGRMNWENQMFRDWDASRRASNGNPDAFDLGNWAANNPIPAFQADAYASTPAIPERGVLTGKTEAPAFRDGQTATNPQTGERMVFRGGNWVPLK